MDIKPLLQQTGGAGKYTIGGRRGDNDKINILRVLACRLHGRPCGLFSQIAGGFILCGNMSFANTGTVLYPLIRGFHHFFQVGIGYDLFRQITPGTCDLRVFQTACLSDNRDSSSELILCGIALPTSINAMLIAFSKATTSAPP